MKLLILLALFVCCLTAAQAHQRSKRQIGGYRFPGSGSRGEYEDDYSKAKVVKREPQYDERPEYRSSSGSTGYPRQAQPSTGQSYGYPPRDNKRVSVNLLVSQSAANDGQLLKQQQAEYDTESGSSSAGSRGEETQEEAEKKPTRLQLLLAESKFACSSKKDGYYADLSVGCQVFHYCVAGVKHSWECPEQTVFHQVHLNCVPAAQDICADSEKFFVVNDYLHKEMDQRGPNNTIRYHQRFYPEEFLGDAALNTPQSWGYPPEQQPRARQQERPQERPQSTLPQRPYSSEPKPYSRPTPAQVYPDDEVYTSPRGSPSSYQSYPPQSYPSNPRGEAVSYNKPTARPSPAPASYSRPETYSAPATYSRPRQSSYPASSSSRPSSYPPSHSSSRPSSSYSPSPARYSSPPSSSAYSPSSSSGYQPLSSRASSAIPSAYQPLSSPPATYSRPTLQTYKKVAATPLPRNSVSSYPSYNVAGVKPYSTQPVFGGSSIHRGMTSSLFAPDTLSMKTGVIYDSDF